MMKKMTVGVLTTVIAISCAFSYMKKTIVYGDAEEKDLSLTAQMFASQDGTIEIPSAYESASRELIDFIGGNLEKLSKEYFKETEEAFEAESIENYATVFIIGEDVFATYIDFNDDNGYMVVTPDFNLYEFVAKGDLVYLKNIDFVYYSPSGGFKYYDKSLHEYVSFERKECVTEEFGETVYAGQRKAGDGYIYDIDAYVADRYSNYTYEREHSIKPYEHINQFDTSIYIKRDKGISSEGNCVLNAAYSVLNCWKKQGYCPSLPSSSDVIRYDPTVREPKHETNLAAGWIVNDTSLWSKDAKAVYGNMVIDNVPKLYADVRQVVYEKGYPYDLNGTNLGLFNANAAYILMYTLQKYSYFPKISNMGNDLSVMEFFFTTHGAAQLLVVSDSSTYKNHAMACIGYKKYKYKSGWWIFSSTKYAHFVEVDDGHSYSDYNLGKSIWYDPNGTSSSKETFFVYDTIN